MTTPETGVPEKRLIVWQDIEHVVRVWQVNTAAMGFEVLDAIDFGVTGRPVFWMTDAASSMSGTDNPDQAEILAEGYIKFDGCSHWDFPGNTLLHLCGRRTVSNWAVMQQRLFDEAARLMAASWCGDS